MSPHTFASQCADTQRLSVTFTHLDRTAGTTIMKMTYGYKVQADLDPIIELVDTAMQQFSLATAPGAFLVDVFPALRRMPSWFPGAMWKRVIPSWQKTLMDMVDIPYDFVTSRMVRS